MMELRTYQKEASDAVWREWSDEGRDRTLMVLPTGTGKTVVFADVVRRAAEQGVRSLVLAHRGELLDQAADKIAAATGLACAREQAESTSVGSFEFVTVGSVQTLMRDKRLSKIDPGRYGVVVVDEAHHALADSYQKVLAHFGGAKVLGCTATPDRGDRRNLGQYFESIAYEYTLPQAIKEGFLVPIQAQTIPLDLDITQVGMSNGDYAAGQLGDALDPYLDAIADEMAAAGCHGMRTVVFLPLVSTAKKFASMLADKGFRSCEVDGNSADRKEVLEAFARGDYDVLCNAMLLTEGWDCPPVDCIVVLRPTRSRPLYCQMVGRGCRPSPETGKERLLLLDFLWLTSAHDLVRPAHLVAGSGKVAERMTKAIAEAGCPQDIQEVMEQAEADTVAEREEALAKELAEMRKRKRKLVDPLQFEMSICAEDLVDYVPQFAWEMGPVTDRQAELLERRGIFPDGIECAGKAGLIIDRLVKRQNEGLTTPKQIRLLESKGYRRVGEWRFEDASRLINAIAATGWKRLPAWASPARDYVPGGMGASATEISGIAV